MQRHLRSSLILCMFVFFTTFSLAVIPIHGQNQDKGKEANEIIATNVDPSKLKTGQRIRILMSHGSQLKGKVAALTERWIKLDMSKEQASLSGVVQIPLDDVASISTLKPLQDADQNQEKQKTNSKKEQKSSEKKKTSSDQAKEGQNKDKKEASDKEAGQASDDKQEGTSKGQGNEKKDPEKLTSEHRQLLEQFPQEKWSQNKYSKLSRKREFQLNSKEKSFLGNWDKLQEARDLQRQNKQDELLQEFHPDDGWTPEKYKYIKNNLGGLGVTGVPQRSEKQNRFLEVYSEWEKAYERYKKKQEKKEEGDQNKKKQESGAK